MPAEPLSPGQARTGEPDDTSIPQAGVPSERPQAPAEMTVNSAVVNAISARATATPELSRTLPPIVSAAAPGARPHSTPRNTERCSLAGVIAGL